MNKKFLTVVFAAAVLGWIASIICHILSLRGVDLEVTFPSALLLHFGVFAVWIPTVIYLRSQIADPGNGIDPFPFLQFLWQRTPKVIVVLALTGCLLGMIQMPLRMRGESGTPSFRDGKYILHGHGTFIREISEAEFHALNAKSFAMFSGIWIAFYGIGAAVCYPFAEQKDKEG